MENSWINCYNDSWKDHIAPESFQHPAKMSYGLLKRILDHCKDEGWGGVIVDPFGGIGSTGILGAYDGYQVICVELEQKFVELAKQNFELHRRGFEEFGCPYPVIIQGDSRKLCEVVEESVELIISSPPFSVGHAPVQKEFEKLSKTQKDDYGQTPGQLGAMKPGKVDMVISSPPFIENNVNIGAVGDTPAKRQQIHDSKPRKQSYGQTKGNLGNLKAGDVDLVVSSPPYEGSAVIASGVQRNESNWQSGKDLTGGKSKHYGETEGQLGEVKGPTFWQAAKEILEQCHKILKPGGHAIWVVKNFVRNKKIVDFEGDWEKLCHSIGFKTVCKHKAMLIKIEKKHSLFGGDIVKITKRASFFRRLAESKGSPPINWEMVICTQKPKE